MTAAARLAYKVIPCGAGCVYVFSVWAGGVLACYRKAMYSPGTHTPVYNHGLQHEADGTRYIIIQHRYDGKKKILLSDIKRARWLRQRIPYASEQTGISARTLRGIGAKIKNLAELYPNHAMLAQAVAKPIKVKKKPPTGRPRKARATKKKKD